MAHIYFKINVKKFFLMTIIHFNTSWIYHKNEKQSIWSIVPNGTSTIMSVYQEKFKFESTRNCFREVKKLISIIFLIVNIEKECHMARYHQICLKFELLILKWNIKFDVWYSETIKRVELINLSLTKALRSQPTTNNCWT